MFLVTAFPPLNWRPGALSPSPLRWKSSNRAWTLPLRSVRKWWWKCTGDTARRTMAVSCCECCTDMTLLAVACLSWIFHEVVRSLSLYLHLTISFATFRTSTLRCHAAAKLRSLLAFRTEKSFTSDIFESGLVLEIGLWLFVFCGIFGVVSCVIRLYGSLIYLTDNSQAC